MSGMFLKIVFRKHWDRSKSGWVCKSVGLRILSFLFQTPPSVKLGSGNQLHYEVYDDLLIRNDSTKLLTSKILRAAKRLIKNTYIFIEDFTAWRILSLLISKICFSWLWNQKWQGSYCFSNFGGLFQIVWHS